MPTIQSLSVLSMSLLLSPTTALRIPTHVFSRRAAVGAAVSFAMVPRNALALTDAEQIAADEAKLAIEKETVNSLDRSIRSLRDKAFKDEIREKEDADLSLDALVKGDKATALKLAEEANLLALDEKKLDEQVNSLLSDEVKEVENERALEAKVASEKAALSAKEEATELQSAVAAAYAKLNM